MGSCSVHRKCEEEAAYLLLAERRTAGTYVREGMCADRTESPPLRRPLAAARTSWAFVPGRPRD